MESYAKDNSNKSEEREHKNFSIRGMFRRHTYYTRHIIDGTTQNSPSDPETGKDPKYPVVGLVGDGVGFKTVRDTEFRELFPDFIEPVVTVNCKGNNRVEYHHPT